MKLRARGREAAWVLCHKIWYDLIFTTHQMQSECLENTHILSSASALLISENSFSAMFVVMTSCIDIQIESREGGG